MYLDTLSPVSKPEAKPPKSSRAMLEGIARLDEGLAKPKPVYSSPRRRRGARPLRHCGQGSIAPVVSTVGAVAPCGTTHS
jgi:hypothetical protein